MRRCGCCTATLHCCSIYRAYDKTLCNEVPSASSSGGYHTDGISVRSCRTTGVVFFLVEQRHSQRVPQGSRSPDDEGAAAGCSSSLQQGHGDPESLAGDESNLHQPTAAFCLMACPAWFPVHSPTARAGHHVGVSHLTVPRITKSIPHGCNSIPQCSRWMTVGGLNVT